MNANIYSWNSLGLIENQILQIAYNFHLPRGEMRITLCPNQWFSTCESRTLQGSNDSFTEVTLGCQKTQALQFITVTKLQLQSSHENNFIIGSQHNLRNCIRN